MSWLFEEANDTEKQVVNILLELSTLITRSAINDISSTAPPPSPHRLLPLTTRTADHRVASQLETSSCRGGNDDDKPVTDDQRIPFIQENSSEIKAASYAPKNKINKIKFKLPSPKSFPQVCYADQSKEIINDNPHSVIVMQSKKNTSDERAKEESDEGMAQPTVSKGHLVQGSRKTKANPVTVLEANNFIHHKKPLMKKSRQEMEKEMMFWEENKLALLEAKDKVNDYLEKQKALNLELKALKLKLSSS